MYVVKVQDTFAEGQASLHATLRKYWNAPVGYEPQHDRAHVVMARQRFTTGADIIAQRRSKV